MDDAPQDIGLLSVHEVQFAFEAMILADEICFSLVSTSLHPSASESLQLVKLSRLPRCYNYETTRNKAYQFIGISPQGEKTRGRRYIWLRCILQSPRSSISQGALMGSWIIKTWKHHPQSIPLSLASRSLTRQTCYSRSKVSRPRSHAGISDLADILHHLSTGVDRNSINRQHDTSCFLTRRARQDIGGRTRCAGPGGSQYHTVLGNAAVRFHIRHGERKTTQETSGFGLRDH
jgi:hypothetical protein